MSELTGVLFLGDTEAVVFTDKELQEFETSDKVRASYKETRKSLDLGARVVEQHNRSMVFKKLERRSKLIRTMAKLRSMPPTEFRKEYETRRDLLARQRNAAGDPETLTAEIEKATESLTAEVSREDMDAFTEALEETDRIEPAVENTRIRRRVGYVPHKFFGRWRLYKQTGTDAEGAPKWEHVAGEHGFWETRKDAVRAASHMAKKAPDGNYKVEQESFRFPEEQATMLTDAGMGRFLGNVQAMTSLEGKDSWTRCMGLPERGSAAGSPGFRNIGRARRATAKTSTG